jgi:Sugar phosphate isomerases/epimerases
VIDEVKPRRTRFSIEMQVGLQPEGPEEYLRLIRAVDRKEFAVHLDACNGINSIDRFYHNTEFIRACFQLLGSRIASCHAKDLQWQPEYSLHLKEVAPGRGSMDYGEYLSQLAKLPFDAPLMLEHLKTPEEYEEGKQHILKTGARLGLSFA